MSVQLQLARNTDTNLGSYTGPQGEMVVSTTDWRPRSQDGTTAGGHKLALQLDLPASYSWPANQFYAAPNGSSGAPTFRVIASADLPSSPVFAGNAAFSAAAGISAAGTTQGTATALTKDCNEVTTVSAGQGVKLPASAAGNNVSVANAQATNALLVYPATGEAINALATNAGFSLAAGKNAIFFCCAAGKWYVVLSA
jgi:hypothetical protein